MLYNASIQGRDRIGETFERQLAVTDANDRPTILRMLKRSAFGDPVA